MFNKVRLVYLTALVQTHANHRSVYETYPMQGVTIFVLMNDTFRNMNYFVQAGLQF